MDDLNELASRIRSLSDAEFEEAIRSVGAALGADERTINKLTREKKTIRHKIDGASKRDLEKIASMLTEEQIDAVRKSIGGADK